MGLIKLTKWVGIVLAFFVIVVWVVLWARFSANYAWVMSIREFYLDKVVIARVLPDKLPHTVQPKRKADEGYWYEMWGRLVSVDYASYTMTIEDKRGEEWKVMMIHAPYHEANKIGIEIREWEVDRETSQKIGRDIPLTIDRREPDKTEPYLVVGDMMDVVWKDKLTLLQIYQAQRKGEYLVMLSGEIKRPIRKVVGK
jgi:hypothetical protein